MGNSKAGTSSITEVSVHPHAGGELIPIVDYIKYIAGSSPRGWGTLVLNVALVAASRFIPTRVGNSVLVLIRVRFHPVHPHAGGELYRRFNTRMDDFGSSPRGWGTPCPLCSEYTLQAVHPHAGGELRALARAGADPIGSSPRGWGTLYSKPLVIPFYRFIPTRVGNSNIRYARRGRVAVHPHAGGELFGFSAINCFFLGSSPRGWGTLILRMVQVSLVRFIPTRVGNSIRTPEPLRLRSVHPHAGGELKSAHDQSRHKTGSSPRGWGTRDLPCEIYPEWRFIPTRVGNSIPNSGAVNDVAVHPHAGGELVSGHITRFCGYGSSPRGWGTQSSLLLLSLLFRFIPTRVGNSLYYLYY